MNTSNIVISSKQGGICGKAKHLTAGEYLNLESNHIICNKKLTLSFKKESFSDEDVIRLGHGEDVYCASYLELTKNDIRIYENTNGINLRAERSHGLRLGEYVSISIEVGYSSAKVTLASDGKIYDSGIIERCWSGRNGKIFAVSKYGDVSNVELCWSCSDYEKDIWLFGDSYFNPTSEIRWTSYLIRDGYTKHLLSGYPGRNTTAALNDFKLALTHGKPKYAVWCMGMNDEDSDTGISASYLKATEEFLNICRENEIIPVLSTIPCVPERNHSFKNAWVKSLGISLIDFAKGVGGEITGSRWYAGMLSPDNVHPDVLGAKALYAQFIDDFPEIKIQE